MRSKSGRDRSSKNALNQTETPKYRRIYSDLLKAIAGRTHNVGERLPSESELVMRYGVSRPTVGRALAQLELEGLVERRAGSGTYVTPIRKQQSCVFGLLIPELGVTEIFEPICQGISQARSGGHDLLWGPLFAPAATKEVQAEQLCEYYLQRDLSGIFFAPLELSNIKDDVNLRIANAFHDAKIPMVLLDRDIFEYPKRSGYDLVGIDNRRAGFLIAEHMLSCGSRRILFFSRLNSAPTVKQRILGFREALRAYDNPCADDAVEYINPADVTAVRAMLAARNPDAIVCSNDLTAARLMTSLNSIGVSVPSAMKVAGMDDVKYASLLQVPLTTIHQPCIDIGITALRAMLDRVAHPDAPARDYWVDFQLVVRESTGSTS